MTPSPSVPAFAAYVAARPASYAPVDVLAPVLEGGRRDIRMGLGIGTGLALLVHGYLVARVAMALISMGEWIADVREEAHAYFWQEQEIETPPEKQQPEKEEELPPPLPPLEPDSPPRPPPPEEIYKDAPAKPAMAPDLVTANDKGQEPEIFNDVYDVDGSIGPIHGAVSPKGEGNDAVTARKTDVDGVKGGTGNGAPTPPPPKVDRSKPPTLVGSTSWSCPFPPEADAEGRDSAVAVIVVTVRPDGSPQGVSVVQDPGSGFGRAARKCALGRKYQAGLDKDGSPTTANTPPIRVKFSR
jgi:protein TonB